ncbi:MAG: hypothetical protein UT12_C0003G0010 [Candidatus Curtissbacteria bacterium GW2011_GWC2_38_9]|uniref:ATP-grasp domain-containing protein n=3 Tax=Candidatus Curtissiibacteriota TaxID=1752717 RepID=A0A1F5HTU6_9BACT|nr:MAG: hypothetical protein UT12_C0003G0010 [Candidatus Curtissbacteria bacterium GW2011_GWC2_38_9]OGE07594.1 MAG: hypothetical protein A2W70_02270 [Candidatus Curtissbacteria bacterium RIFCSPLOWO2_02_41_11]
MFKTIRILVLGAGGSPATNFIRSLRESHHKFYIVGTDANKYYFWRSEADKTYLIPDAKKRGYIDAINRIVSTEKIQLIYAANDQEIARISRDRQKLKTKVFLPSKKTVSICQDKYLSYLLWEKSGLCVPKTFLLKTSIDIKKAFVELGNKIWLRQTKGAFGKGSIIADNFQIAKAWVEFKQGWGYFTAASYLSPNSITWQSIYRNGRLICAQGRRRILWEIEGRSPSGISGITGVGKIETSKIVDEIAQKSILAIDKRPHGIYSVDMTFDKEGIPNPTEINIGRFFTTSYFLTKAGLNMPEIFVKTALGMPTESGLINPIRKEYYWIRGVDFLPKLIAGAQIKKYDKQ